MIKSASLYNHFPSKEDILVFVMNDYIEFTVAMFSNPELPSIIEKDPTADGILSCIPRSFMVLEDKYYSAVTRVLFHEQFRNDVVRNHMVKLIQKIEQFVESVFSELKKLNVIRDDADPEYWKKITSSLFYASPARMMLNIGQNSPDYTGLDLMGLLHYMFEMILTMYRVEDSQAVDDNV